MSGSGADRTDRTVRTHVVAVDLGASGGRVLWGAWRGEHVTVEELHRFDNGPVEVLGRLHWDALALWQGIREGLTRYARQVGEPLAGIGVDAWGVDFALLDERGALLGNPHHYRDVRTDGAPEQVFARVPRERIYGRSGVQILQINTLYQLYVMRDDPPLRAADTLLMMPDLFHYWLTGRRASELTIASTTQFLAAHSRTWDRELLRELGLPDRVLPELIEPGTRLGSITPALAADLGLAADTPVIAPASHDTASAVAAIDGLERAAYLSSGTWSLMGAELDAPILSDAARACNFTNEAGVGGTVRFLKNIAGMWPLQECRRQWRREGLATSWNDLLSAAADTPPFAHLIDPDAAEFNPPGDMPTVIRSYCRAHAQAEPATVGALVRTVLESLALKYRTVLDDLETVTGRSFDTLRVVGGGSRNALLCQLTADACRRPVIAGPVEATALGNLMIQAVAAGHLDSVEQGRQAVAASFETRRYEPRGGGGWDEALERFRALLA